MKLLGRTPSTVPVPDVLARSEAGSSPLVAQAGSDELAALVDSGRLVDVPAGAAVVAADDLGCNCVFVLDGRLDVVRDGEVVADIAPGWFGGEMSIRHHQRRNASLVAAVASRVLVVSRGDFETLYATCPSIRAHVDATIETRLAQPLDSSSVSCTN